MHNSDFYREEAARYRELAESAKDEATKQELLELAAACEGIADNIDDLRRAAKTLKLGEGGRVGLRSRDAASRCAFVLGFKHSLRSVQFCR
jgi:hypothetical protein